MVCGDFAGQFFVRMWSIAIRGRNREFAGKVGVNPAPECSPASR